VDGRLVGKKETTHLADQIGHAERGHWFLHPIPNHAKMLSTSNNVWLRTITMSAASNTFFGNT
jgi:hypothetical protein